MKVKSKEHFKKFEVFSIVETYDVPKFIWVNEATKLIYSGLPSHFSFKECHPRFIWVTSRPDNLNWMRLFAASSANWPLLSRFKQKKLDENYAKMKEFDSATRKDVEINDSRYNQREIYPGEQERE